MSAVTDAAGSVSVTAAAAHLALRIPSRWNEPRSRQKGEPSPSQTNKHCARVCVCVCLHMWGTCISRARGLEEEDCLRFVRLLLLRKHSVLCRKREGMICFHATTFLNSPGISPSSLADIINLKKKKNCPIQISFNGRNVSQSLVSGWNIQWHTYFVP